MSMWNHGIIYPGLFGQGTSVYPSGFIPVEVHGKVQKNAFQMSAMVLFLCGGIWGDF